MTYSVDVYDKTGKVVSKVTLNEELFSDDKVNKSLIHEYYLLQTSNVRLSIAHTKTRGEVAGSGRKLYKQKGTGNARVGDKKSPIRRKGWVAFGPRKERNFLKDMPKKARRRALCGLVVLKAKDNVLMGLKGFSPKAPSTKEAATVLSKIGIAGDKVLVVLEDKNEILEKSFRNIKKVKYLHVDYLNPYDLMHYNKILFTEKALEKLNTSK